ncbi:amino acid adenylation domain-containing protein, partial [Streptomyces sp. NPDC025273]|uniref:amino acid adenylation domain-containing protein n=1 Tax=Streptomyces sp. NPDC025273 TaxID=3155251 RepID=UPI0033DCCB35
LDLPGLVARPVDGEGGAAKFDLGFNFVERTDPVGAPAGIEVTVEYSSDLFDESTVTDLGRRLVRMLSLGAADPAMPLSQLDLLESREWQQLLTGWNDTGRALELPAATVSGPEPETVAGLFAAQVARTPDGLALMAGDERLSYTELDERSAALAALLLARGVRRGDTVAVAVPRSAALTVGHLAVLRAGAVCLPVEPHHPAERIRAVLAGAAPAAVVTTEGCEPLIGTLPCPVVLLHLDGDSDGDGFAELPGPLPDSPAYLIHAADPEGSPRGVLVPHRGIVNRLLWMRDACRLGPDDRILHKAPADLDVSVWELLAPLVLGAAQVLAPPGGDRDMVGLARLIRRDAVTTAHFAPSVLEAFLAEPEAARCTGLRRVLCSGGPLPAGLAERFRAHLPGAELHVLHGPTEASFDAIAWTVGAGTEGAYPPVGRPVWNTRAFVLDAGLMPLPPGSPGALYLGGVQLAHGYLGRAALTAERFVADPYGPPGSRLYRTGDLARITRDGTVELLGRTDDRLTLDGRSVEPGEIERVLTGHPAVGAAAVTVRPGPSGEPALVAYHVPAGPAGPADAEALRAHTATVLPGHAVPAHYVVLDALPHTADGRIDRAALPEPRHSTARAPRNDVERTLCDLFSELLGVPSVSIDDSFFDLGGHSLLATRLVSRVRATFGIELPFRDIFDAQSVVALAERVVGSSVGGRVALVPMVRPDR